MKTKVPKTVQIVELHGGKYDIRCLQCVRSITVASTQGSHAQGFYIRHTHAKAKA